LPLIRFISKPRSRNHINTAWRKPMKKTHLCLTLLAFVRGPTLLSTRSPSITKVHRREPCQSRSTVRKKIKCGGRKE
jgi:hypothetical protein